MLSDACSEYLSSDLPKTCSALQLKQDVQHYAALTFDYPSDMLEALRQACQDVLGRGGVGSVERLDRLAESIMRHLDSPWLNPDWQPPTVDPTVLADQMTVVGEDE